MPTFKTEALLLLVMYCWLNTFYCEMNGKYSITLAEIHDTPFVTKDILISYINSKCHIMKLKSSRTCLIGYSGFISREWILIA